VEVSAIKKNRKNPAKQQFRIETGYNTLIITDKELVCKKCKSPFFLIRPKVGNFRESLSFLQTITQFGKSHSDSATADILRNKYGKKKFCNSMYVKRKIDVIGKIVKEFHAEEHLKKQCLFAKTGGAKELICVMDGTYIHHWHKKKKNFAVIALKVFNPENMIEISKNRTVILKSRCSGVLGTNNKFLVKELMRCLLSEGWNYETKVYFCADGEEKLWKTGKEKICNSTGILDWFHITKRLTEIFLWQTAELKLLWQKAKENLWKGNVDNALNILDNIKIFDNAKIQKKIDKFIQYLENNREYIIDYNSNQDNDLPISSAIAESLIEQLVSPRLKKKQKMQWSKSSAENVLQIRSCYLNKEDNLFWDYYIENAA